MKIKKFIASEICALDSDVHKGGGTDVTEVLQKVLDNADENTGIYLVMDGAALIRGLRLHSNTTIECLTRDCGFYLADNSSRALVTNYDWDFKVIRNRNITLIGGTYNHNCLHQEHDLPLDTEGYDNTQYEEYFSSKWTNATEFYGVENLIMRDLTLSNQRTFTLLAANWRNIVVENVVIDLPDYMYAQNQDGLHFWGPGEFLMIKNLRGCAGDDFIALAPDEHDHHSDITDVVIDGVTLEHADQGIRMLSRGTGKLDRVTVKNVSGTYKSFGFYINCWFPDTTYGDFGSIYFENIDLRPEETRYDYRAPMLFSVGGNLECLTVKNLRHHFARDNRAIMELGIPFYDISYKFPVDNKPKLKTVIIDGLTITSETPEALDASYIQLFDRVEQLVIKNVLVLRDKGIKKGALVELLEGGSIGKLIINDADAEGFETLVRGDEKVDSVTIWSVKA